MRREGRTFSPHFNRQRHTNATIRVCDCVTPTHLAMPKLNDGRIILAPGESPELFHKAHRLALLRSTLSNAPNQIENLRLNENYQQIQSLMDERDSAKMELEKAEVEWNQLVDEAWEKSELNISYEAFELSLPRHPYPLSFEIHSHSLDIYRSIHHYTAMEEAHFTAGWGREMQASNRKATRRSRRTLREGSKKMAKFCKKGGKIEEVTDRYDDICFDKKPW
ncbi:hypothetical protein K7432_005636 [Basidiobolus ranarum]|uniref:Uncharacterized protein n=1 Tax=Basidiobolus ranarum TaxID=34480 RepID=A0ABR2WWD0_9FUNG